jgi:hypothetical protein
MVFDDCCKLPHKVYKLMQAMHKGKGKKKMKKKKKY